MTEAKIVLITGTSTGLGAATARFLAERGWRVFGGSLDPEGDEKRPGVETLPLDIRDDEKVARCVDEAYRRAGRLDALVNNAGFAIGGAIEEFTLDEAKAQFETNFFGLVRMVQAVLPRMRAAGGGRIVNISSGAGFTAEPFAGFYTASKFAIEGYSEALYHEVLPFRVRVSIVEPGWFRTPILSHAKEVAHPLAEYDRWRRSMKTLAARYCEEGADPIRVAKCVDRILRSRSPRLRYRVGKDVTMSFWLRRFLPESLFLGMIRDYYKLDS